MPCQPPGKRINTTLTYFNATDRADAEICDFLIPTLRCAFGYDCDRSKEDLVTYYGKWQSDMSVKQSKDYWNGSVTSQLQLISFCGPSHLIITSPPLLMGFYLPHPFKKFFPGVTNPLDLNHLEHVAMLFVHIFRRGFTALLIRIFTIPLWMT